LPGPVTHMWEKRSSYNVLSRKPEVSGRFSVDWRIKLK
jgi:hypothetical protein